MMVLLGKMPEVLDLIHMIFFYSDLIWKFKDLGLAQLKLSRLTIRPELTTLTNRSGSEEGVIDFLTELFKMILETKRMPRHWTFFKNKKKITEL